MDTPMVQPTFAVTVQPRSMPGATATDPPSVVQTAALVEAITPDIADRLLDSHDEVVVTLRRTTTAEAWVPIEAPDDEGMA